MAGNLDQDIASGECFLLLLFDQKFMPMLSCLAVHSTACNFEDVRNTMVFKESISELCVDASGRVRKGLDGLAYNAILEVLNWLGFLKQKISHKCYCTYLHALSTSKHCKFILLFQSVRILQSTGRIGSANFAPTNLLCNK